MKKRMATQKVFDKLAKEFNEKYVCIISFYKENGGITISDSDLEKEIVCHTEYTYAKSIAEYDLLFDFKINKDKIDFKLNDNFYSLSWNESFYYELGNNKTIWICSRDYENHFD